MVPLAGQRLSSESTVNTFEGVPATMTAERAPVEVLKVSATSKPVAVAGAIAGVIRSKGRVINISSVGGRIAMATYGPYAGTKFALEAVSDSLRREMAPDVEIGWVLPLLDCLMLGARLLHGFLLALDIFGERAIARFIAHRLSQSSGKK